MLNSPKSRLRAWLELCRISNLPTIWTNVLVGSAIAAGLGRRVHDDNGIAIDFPFRLDWWQTGAMLIAMSLFYIAGMALNDIVDADTDAVERPSRPIPSGRVSRTAALSFVFACCFNGLCIVFALKPEAMWMTLLLLMAIIAYDLLHKRFVMSVLIMGLCRSLVVLACATGGHIRHLSDKFPFPGTRLYATEIFWSGQAAHFDRVGMLMALALGLYIVGITVIARGETEDRIDFRKWLAPLMPLLVLAAAAVTRPDDWRWAAGVAFALSLWLARPIRFVFARPPRTIAAILTWLAGICLVDAYFLALLDAPILALIAIGCFILTAWGHRKIIGT